MKYCFGVDIGGTTVKMGLFEKTGEILDKWEIVSKTENEGEAVLPDIAESIKGKIQERGLEEADIVGIGVGVPAPVTADGVVNGSANIGWGYKDVKGELEGLTGLPTEVGNDANVAALGEMWQGGGEGETNIVMVTLGTGVGGGVIIGGKVVVGTHGAGGEIGHLCVNYDETEICGCGNKGCLEQYASATGIVRLARKKLAAETRKTVLQAENVTAKDVFDAVKAGDTVAQEVAEEFGRFLGYCLANLAIVTDPAVIVIGGGVSRAGEVLIPYIQKPFLEKAFFANKDVEFKLATLGNDAGICGAAKLILDERG
ncbi:ROK family glucokinase [Mediterraneibacter agrestimuris]|uniref:ROK family glucokinase n=1 Tax=Mediterraneibacter agrestimuris TaxID=2941333 RepID=UPI0020411875|nr:ROK family glucokinase [Mediterraneibacter agrestimuris]